MAKKKDVSERTIEVNTLIDFAYMARQLYGAEVTIYAPSLREERDFGFDDIIHGLPRGKNLVFQFKKPKSYESDNYDNFVRFEIDSRQFHTLLNIFDPGGVFYVFVALNTFEEIVINRRNLLNHGTCCDVHNIPNDTNSFQKTRVARMVKSFLTPPPQVEIADHRRFRNVPNLLSLKELCRQAILCHKGMTNDRLAGVMRHSDDRDAVGEVANWKHTYFVHLKPDNGISMNV